jgi:hypothetical protein
MGLQPGQGEVVARGLVEGFYKQAAKAAVHSGVPADRVSELWSWAAENAPLAQRHAASALVLGRDVSGVRTLATMWLTEQRRLEGNRD